MAEAPRDPEIAQVVHELLQESLLTLLPVTAIVGWVWASIVLLLQRPKAPYAYAVLALTALTVGLALLLSRRRLHLALGVYLAGLTGAVTLSALVFANPAVLYLYMLVVLIAAMLTSGPAMWGATIGSAALVAAVGLQGRGDRPADLVLPIAFVLLTGLASWVGSRRLFTALGWALSMTKEAQKNASRARQHRAELRRALKSLDEAYVRLERANEALAVAQEAAQRAYRLKAEFVANVSHELRTPLNLITGFAAMITTAPESYGAVLPREFRGDLMAIYRAAQHLSDLVDDVLDLSRIEAGRMPLIREPSDLSQVAHEAAEMVRGLVEARGLRLDLHAPPDLPRMWIDRTRIRQVLLNLLTNAARFTDQGGIRVGVTLQEREAIVTITDSGRGIPPERIERAFDAFSQLDDDQVREGSGLGLAVSKRFVEMHGGRMWIESRMEQGTTVGLALPLPRDGEPAPALTYTPRPQARHGPPLVLVVHEDPRILPLLRRHVEGCRFLLAETVGKVAQAIRDALPAAILLDAAGSSDAAMAGFDLPSHMPVITCPLPSMHRLGLLVSAADYLPKPVSRDELQGALARLPAPPQTVLVADDDPHMVRLLARMIKAGLPDARVLQAFGGQEALELVRAARPQLLLLDLVMPEVSGYDVLQRLREDSTLAGTQVIIISAHSVEEEAAPLLGELRLARGAGFSLTTVLQLLRATLPEVTALETAAPDGAAARSEDRPVPGVW